MLCVTGGYFKDITNICFFQFCTWMRVIWVFVIFVYSFEQWMFQKKKKKKNECKISSPHPHPKCFTLWQPTSWWTGKYQLTTPLNASCLIIHSFLPFFSSFFLRLWKRTFQSCLWHCYSCDITRRSWWKIHVPRKNCGCVDCSDHGACVGGAQLRAGCHENQRWSAGLLWLEERGPCCHLLIFLVNLGSRPAASPWHGFMVGWVLCVCVCGFPHDMRGLCRRVR